MDKKNLMVELELHTESEKSEKNLVLSMVDDVIKPLLPMDCFCMNRDLINNLDKLIITIDVGYCETSAVDGRASVTIYYDSSVDSVFVTYSGSVYEDTSEKSNRDKIALLSSLHLFSDDLRSGLRNVVNNSSKWVEEHNKLESTKYAIKVLEDKEHNDELMCIESNIAIGNVLAYNENVPVDSRLFHGTAQVVSITPKFYKLDICGEGSAKRYKKDVILSLIKDFKIKKV